MATEKHITANQRNARRSTGPKSVEGKLSSKFNAVRHGLTAQQIVIPGEDPTEFEELYRSLIKELGPHGEMESQLVERIATSMWRLRRITIVEAGIFAYESLALNAKRAAATIEQLTVTENIPDLGELEETTITDDEAHEEAERKRDAALESMTQRLPTLGATYIEDAQGADSLSKLTRYEANIERSLYRAFHELQRQQEARKSGKTIAPVAVDVTLDVNPTTDID